MGTEIYDPIEYFLSNPNSFEEISWYHGQLRYGTQIDAIAYALGFQSFEDIRSLFGYSDDGKSNYPVIGVKEQLIKLLHNHSRTPQGVIEIGGGKGEVSMALASMNIPVQMIEPSKSAPMLINATMEKLGLDGFMILHNMPLGNSVIHVDWNKLDTVIMVESLEHIDQDEFDGVFLNYIKPTLQRNKGMLIITNWIGYWPLECVPPYHCREVNDLIYDWLSRDGKIIYRNGSHLVVQY